MSDDRQAYDPTEPTKLPSEGEITEPTGVPAPGDVTQPAQQVAGADDTLMTKGPPAAVKAHRRAASISGGRPQRRGRQNTVFWATVFASLLLHGTAIAGFAIWKGRPPQRVDLSRAIPVQLVRLGKARPKELLPRKVAPARPPPSEGVALDTGKTPEKPAKRKPEKKPKKQPELSDAARQMLQSHQLDSALSKIKGSDEPEGSPDGDPLGTATEGLNAAAGYHAEIIRALKASYHVPTVIPTAQRRFLRARVVLFIEANGKISKHEFVERHPNKVFMGALESLLQKIQLPPPPRKHAKVFRRDGVEIIFRP